MDAHALLPCSFGRESPVTLGPTCCLDRGEGKLVRTFSAARCFFYNETVKNELTKFAMPKQ